MDIDLYRKKHWIDAAAEISPAKIALADFNRKVTFKELQQYARAYAGFLTNENIKKKEHVAVRLKPGIEYVISILGLWYIGALPVLVNLKHTDPEIKKDLIFTKCSHIISEDKYPGFKKLDTPTIPGISREDFTPVEYSSGKNAMLIFTSGTVKNPKPVLLTFSSFINSFNAFNGFAQVQKNDTWLASLPLYHIGGFSIITRSLLSCSKLFFADNLSYEALSAAIKKFKPTYFSAVPTMLGRFIKNNFKMPAAVKYMFIGGGPSENGLIEKAISMDYPIVKVYGSTETCSMITAVDNKKMSKKIRSSGKPLEGVKLFVSPKGEIVVKSPTLFKKYCHNKEETEKKLKNGLYYTGDFGIIDSDGYLYVESRRKDLILTGGENVNPVEVAYTVSQIKGIDDCFVFPTPDGEWGQAVNFALVLEKDFFPSNEELNSLLKEHLAAYKMPKKIYLLEEIPRTELGKVMTDRLMDKINLQF